MRVSKTFKLNRADRAWNYKRIGEIARNKIIKLVQKENINFKQTYEAARNKNAHYQQKFDYVDNLIKKSIIMPKYTDYTPMQQTIIIAHELGHYAVYKNSNPSVINFLIKGGKYITYLNEYLAWRKAKKILKKMKLWKVSGVEGEFKNIMYNSLSTYKPSEKFSVFLIKRFLKTLYIAIKYLVLSYFAVGLVYLFDMEGIPTPINLINREQEKDINSLFFYGVVFFIYLFSLIIKIIVIKTRKDR